MHTNIVSHMTARKPPEPGPIGPSPSEGRRHEVFTVASYNIHKCVGTDGMFNPLRVKKVLLELNADIVALQEADARFGDRKGLLDLELLESLGGYRAVADIGSSSRSHGWHGNVLLYREGSVKAIKLLALPGLEPRGALIVDLELPKATLRIIAAHLGLLRRSRAQQVAMILEAAQPLDHHPVIVMGDMNEWRVSARSALTMFEPHLSSQLAVAPSFPSRRPVFPLDRILVSANVRVLEFGAVDTPLSRLASDHLPIVAKIAIARSAAAAAPG